jgi:hypothetical protein
LANSLDDDAFCFFHQHADTTLPRADKFSGFEQAILPHLDAAYNLARWLMRDENEAADAVQGACLGVLHFIGGWRPRMAARVCATLVIPI